MTNSDHGKAVSHTRFTINLSTRALITDRVGKSLVVGDRDSERFTFVFPRYINGHDMSLCDRVEIHYNNTDPEGRYNSADVYECGDLTITEGDGITFSWLLSGNATRYAGTLAFLCKLKCLDGEGNVVYAYHSDIYDKVTVREGKDNTGAVVAVLPDVLAAWKEEALQDVSALADTATAAAGEATAAAARAATDGTKAGIWAAQAGEDRAESAAAAELAKDAADDAENAVRLAKTSAENSANHAVIALEAAGEATDAAGRSEAFAAEAAECATAASDHAVTAANSAVGAVNSATAAAESAAAAQQGAVTALAAVAESAPSIVVSIATDAAGGITFLRAEDAASRPVSGLRVQGRTATANTPDPTVSQALQCVPAGTQVFLYGKNLLPFDSVTVGADDNGVKAMELPRSLPAGTYTVSGLFTNSSDSYKIGTGFYFYEGESKSAGTFALSAAAPACTVTFARPVNKLHFYSTNSGSTNKGVTAEYKQLQLEAGSVATGFAPYQEPTELLTPHDLYFGDVWYPCTGVIKRGTAIKTFDGSEHWEVLNSGTDRFYYQCRDIDDALTGSYQPSHCNRYPANMISATGAVTYTGAGVVWHTFRVRWGEEVDIATFKAQLRSWSDAGAPLVLAYLLAEPVTEQVSPVHLFTQRGTVTAAQLPVALPADLGLDYVADTKLYIDGKLAELQAAILSSQVI